VGTAEEVIAEFGDEIDDPVMVPSGGGVFEVTVGDELVYSKRATGRHADPGEIVDAIRRLLGRPSDLR